MRKALKDIYEVAHFWANKVQPGGSAGNVYFQGDIIFSYGPHFPLAKHLPNGSVAFTTQDSSRLTSKHKGLVRRAASHLNAIFVHNAADGVLTNKGAAQQAIDRIMSNAAVSRTTAKRQRLLAEALGIAENFNLFAKAYKDRSRINAKALLGLDLNNLKEVLARKEKAKAAAAAKAERVVAKEAAEALARWRTDPLNGEFRCSWPMAFRYSWPMALRVAGDEVQTTHGARIPIDDAIRLWPIILRVKGGDHDYDVGQQVGQYRLTRIRRDGSIVVGCHDIPFGEIEGIARDLSLIDVSHAQVEHPSATA